MGVEFLTLFRVFSAFKFYFFLITLDLFYLFFFDKTTLIRRRHDLPGCVNPPLPPLGVVPTYGTDLLFSSSFPLNIVIID